MDWNPDFILHLVLLLACTAIGATVGSFLNVCIYRLPIGLTVTQPPRSFCPKCRHCKSPIPIWYFLVELYAGLGAALAYLRLGPNGALSFTLFFSFAVYTLRTARRGYPPNLKLTIAVAISGILILGLRPASTLSFFLSLIISALAAREMVSRWSPTGPVTEPNLKLVITICALVSGMWIAVAVTVAIILFSRSTKAEEQFLGYQDALILLGICLGAL